jgi:glutamate synthase (NADPH) small chain
MSMHDPRSFLHVSRVEPERQPPRRRLRHWHEYESLLSERDSAKQAERCMDCGVPWCHGYCPVHNQIPDWNALVSESDWHAAWEQLESTNNFPELTGRLCPAPCEDACTLRLSDAPVTIRAIELAIIERAFRTGWVKPQPAAPGSAGPAYRIAVVGSGPAGLACAQQLARAGHLVSVYEAAERIGGLLRYGIPDFRLEKWVLDRRLAQMRAEGVRFHTGRQVGSDPDAMALRHAHDALVFACGSSVPRDLAVPGRNLRGIHDALDYLSRQNRRLGGVWADGQPAIDARDLDVVVIGGGDTGSDCVGTAIRQGARSVIQIQYHAAPPHHGDVLQHWPKPVPELHPNDHDAEGNRRVWGWNTVAFDGQYQRVGSLTLQRLRWWRDEDGGWQHEPMPGEIRRLPAQLVLIAIGYRHPAHGEAIAQLDLALDARGNLAADDRDYRTNVEGVFACGDARRGQSLIVWAIREGRQCAEAVDRSLRGQSDLPRL